GLRGCGDGLGLALALALALAFLLLGLVLASVVLLGLGALVGLDAVGVRQTGAARGHRTNEVAVLARLGLEGTNAGDGDPLPALVVLGVELLGEGMDGIGLVEALDELEAGALGSGAAPLEVGIPLLRPLVLDDGSVIVLVAVLAVLREAAHVTDA